MQDDLEVDFPPVAISEYERALLAHVCLVTEALHCYMPDPDCDVLWFKRVLKSAPDEPVAPQAPGQHFPDFFVVFGQQDCCHQRFRRAWCRRSADPFRA